MFDILAIDWGSVRYGLAFGSSSSGLVLPYVGEVPAADIWTILEKEIVTRKISTVILGYPTNFQLGNTATTDRILEFREQLASKFPSLNIHTVNERNTTKASLDPRFAKNKTNLNHLAAVKILELWLGEEV